ncbi:hypothetical protein HZB58_02370 [Candidatus Gottesmanbacteria bacterium]|nr:hypothetical protein [Candidatus Gottesmanbacteria bacterium]
MKAFRLLGLSLGFLLLATVLIPRVSANHSWGGYHWARTANPYTLKLGDNVSSAWKPYLSESSADWSVSSMLDTTIVAGNGGKNCKATAGRIEVCNRKYGNNGWLGLAQVWVNGTHITQALAKMNDTYFTTNTYNKPEWRRLVMCQEIAHGLGLDHQDEAFDNTNLGTCMDYTSNPLGPPSNEHPNAHDYEELEIIYAHLDGITTVGQSMTRNAGKMPEWTATAEFGNASDWGKEIRNNGHVALYERDFGGGNKLFSFVIFAR